MTVRTYTARLFGASARSRTLFGGGALAVIAVAGLFLGAQLSGLSLPGFSLPGVTQAGRDTSSVAWYSAAVRLPGSQVVRPVTADHLDALLKQANFDLDAIRSDEASVPRIYVRRLPADLVEVSDTQRRKKLFFSTLLPLILMANEALLAERRQVEDLRARYPGVTPETGLKDFAPADRRWLEAVFAHYETLPGDWRALLLKLDEIPVSLMMAQAIQESGWGTSRFARDGNALFGQRTWNEAEEGIVPDLRAKGESYRVKSFPDLMAAVRSYMWNLNTHEAYEDLRARRAGLRRNPVGQPGKALTGTLIRYSEESAGYVKALNGLIRDNDLSDLNEAKLGTAPNLLAARSEADL